MPRSRNMRQRSKTMKRRGNTSFRKKGRKSVKASNKPSWIKFVTKFHKEQSKKNKNWTFKDSLKNAKKYWK